MRWIHSGALGILGAAALWAQNDWPAYGRDPGGMRYSTMTQINRSNVSRLARAWTYHTGEQGRYLETTPLVVGGVMYLSTQQQRVVAIASEALNVPTRAEVDDAYREIQELKREMRRLRKSIGVAASVDALPEAATSARIARTPSPTRLRNEPEIGRARRWIRTAEAARRQ